MPRVTVLMAVHNGAPYLLEAIDSIRSQTYHDFEFLIVDDASTDGSGDIARSCGDRRIRLFENHANLGLAKSLNRGLALARGQFVARQDADDVSEPERLEHQVRYLDAHRDVALLGTCHTEIDADGRFLRRHILPTDDTSLRWALLFHCPFVHSSVMFRRALVLGKVGSYDESFGYAMDYELWTRIARVFPVANLPESLLRLRTHSDSMTATSGEERLSEGERLRRARLARMLKLSERGVADAENRVVAVESLYRGASPDREVDDLLDAVDDMLALQRVFAREAGLDARACKAHRVRVLRHVARRLVAFEDRRRSSAGPVERLRLRTRALRLRVRANLLAATGFEAIGPAWRPGPAAYGRKASGSRAATPGVET